jgi:hypothetical protein
MNIIIKIDLIMGETIILFIISLNIYMELQIISALQYSILSTVGKEVVLPLFINNITNISAKILTLKNKSGENNILLKKEIDDTDLEFKMVTIATFLKEISVDDYKSNTVHIHLCGIYDVFEQINKELTILNEESDHMSTSWWYYTIEWSYFKSKVNFANVKKQVKLLNDRYDMLLKILTVQNHNKKN